MEQLFPMQVVARIRSDFSSKFGVPRQSGLVDALEAAVVFEPEFRNPDAVRGLVLAVGEKLDLLPCVEPHGD